MPSKSEASVRWLQNKETTFYVDEMKLQERWQYYISSYLRTDPTEGVDRERLSKVVLSRNVPSTEADSDDGSQPKAVSFDENLAVNICLRSSKMVWGPGSAESFLYTPGAAAKEDKEEHEKPQKRAGLQRAHKLREKFVMNNPWMKDLSQEDVEKQKADYKTWSEAAVGGEGDKGGEGEEAAEGRDVQMSG